MVGSSARIGLVFPLVHLAIWLKSKGLDVLVAGYPAEHTPGLKDQLKAASVLLALSEKLCDSGPKQIFFPNGELSRICDEFEPDVALLCAMGHVVDLAKRSRRRPPTVWWLRSIRNTRFYAPLARRMGAFLANRYASECWVQCELERSLMLNAGLNADKVHTMPQPHDTDLWEQKADQPLDKIFQRVIEAVQNGHPVLCYPASLLPGKRHRDLILAIKLVKRRYPNVLACCPGPGNAAELRQFADANGVVDNFFFTESPVPQMLIPPLVKQSDMTVICSESETYCKILVEAAGLAKPIVSTRVGVAVEGEQADAVSVLDIGDYQAMAEHILKILDNPSEKQRRGQRARQWCLDNYSYHAVGQNMCDRLTSLAESRA